MVKVYRRREFSIYSGNDGFIVHNTHKEFSQGHTHITNFNTAKYLIDMSLQKQIPYRTSAYLIESLIRLSNDRQYTERLKQELVRLQKKKMKKGYN